MLRKKIWRKQNELNQSDLANLIGIWIKEGKGFF